jgi:hypothetical protein
MKRERQIEQMEGARERLDRRARELLDSPAGKETVRAHAAKLQEIKALKGKGSGKRARA